MPERMERVAALRAALSGGEGDGWLQDCLAADERGELWPHGVAALDRLGFGLELVPRAEGGSLAGAERLVDVLREVCRHDPALALGHGASAFIAAVNVWTGGQPAQRAAVAGLLRDRRRIACAYHELAHGNDLMRLSCAAQALPGGAWRLSGGKQVIANLERADAMVLMARTEASAGGRSHSLLLAHRSDFSGTPPVFGPRHATVGMRGVELGSVRFDGCELPAGALLGQRGQGAEIALKAFQVTRIVLPGMFAGVLDAGLSAAVRHLRARTLYGAPATALPAVATTLAAAYADLLLCDVFVRMGARLLTVSASQVGACSGAIKYLVPGLLVGAVTSLSTLMGSAFYLRGGPQAHFQKLVRDIKPASFGHASRASCLMTLAAQLPALARKGWSQTAALDERVVRGDIDDLPLRFDELAMFGGSDPLAAGLRALAQGGTHGGTACGHELAAWTDELDALQRSCRALPASAYALEGAAVTYPLAARLARLQAASACLHWWQRDSGDAFFRQPAWLEAVLYRLRHAGSMVAEELPAPLAGALWADLVSRVESGIPLAPA